ncbi:MAG: hypothetical protein KGJ90_01925 [Patescibacteria group bacterium]|nr:hypothetical protein [Patescibacteria group bacterium]
MANIGEIVADPDFSKFSPTDKEQIINKALAADAEFGKLSSADQVIARGHIYSKVGISTPTTTQPTALGQVGRGLLKQLPIAGSVAGGMAGLPLGLAGSLGGAGLGYTVGSRLERGIESYTAPEEVKPETKAQALIHTATDIPTGAAMEALGQVTGAAGEAEQRLINKIVDSVIGATPLKLGAKEREAAVVTAKAGLDDLQKRLGEKRLVSLANENDKIEKNLADTARQEKIQQLAGRTSAQTTASKVVPGWTGTTRPTAGWMDYESRINRVITPAKAGQDAINADYEGIISQNEGFQFDNSDLRSFLESEGETWKASFASPGGTLWKEADRVLNPKGKEGEALIPPKPIVPKKEAAAAVAAETPAAKPLKYQPMEYRAGYASWRTPELAAKHAVDFAGKPVDPAEYVNSPEFIARGATPEQKRYIEGARAAVADWSSKKPVANPNEPTIRDLFNLRIKANRVLRSSADGTTSHFARELKNGINQKFAESGIKGLPELDRENASYHGTFSNLLDVFGDNTKSPLEKAKALYSDPAALRRIVESSAFSAENKTTASEMFGDYLNDYMKGGAKLTQQQARDLAPSLKVIYGKDNPLANPDHWMYLEDRINNFPYELQSLPVTQLKYQQAMQESTQRVIDDYADDFIKGGLDIAQKLGGSEGEKLAAAINSGITKQAQASTVMRSIMGLDPQQAMVEALKTGRLPKGGQTLLDDLEKAGTSGNLVRLLRNRGFVYLMAVGLGATSPYMSALGIAGGAGLTRMGLQAGLKYALRSGLIDATKYAAAIDAPTEGKAIGFITNMMARGLVQQQIDRGKPQLEPIEPEPRKPLPKTKAENVSMKATGSTKLADLSNAPIQVVMNAYDKAVREDANPETAAKIRSILTAKARDVTVAGLDAKSRVDLARIMKEAPELDTLDQERSLARGTV